MVFIGIDISKLSFDAAALIDNETYLHGKFDNNLQGFKAFSKWAKSTGQECVFCLEATGIYSLALAKFLCGIPEKTVVANPIKTHSFAKMEMNRNKTDKADAMSIARYCRHLSADGVLDKNLFKPKGVAFEKVQFLTTRLEQLTKLRHQEGNRLDVSLDKDASLSIKQMLSCIDRQIKRVKQAIKSTVNSDEVLKKQVALLVSIDGFGEKTAWSILAYLGDISLFSNAKQVSSYAGLSPRLNQSGSSLNRSSLSKIGNKRLRKALYMPAVVAIRHNPLMIDLYARLKEKGKPGKVILCAVMRKLLVLAYGVLKSEKPFDVNYQINSI